MYKYYTKDIKSIHDLDEDEVFVSNLAGRHGKGAAKFARDYLMADTGTGYGFTGFCFAIPTKGYNLEVLPLEEIEEYVRLFKINAKQEPNITFYVTKIGCGLAGYNDHEIAPLFKGSPSNCKFHNDWKKYL